MNRHDRYAEWDAAYVLGSLSSAERHEYEQHLATCAGCRTAVAELAAVPALLAKVPAGDVAASVEDEVPARLLPSLVRQANRRRRRSRAALGAVMAVAAAIAIIVPLAVSGALLEAPGRGSDVVTLSQVVASPLEAEIRLVPDQWGTRIDMTCRYRGGASDYSAGPSQYSMWVTDQSGSSTQLATWTAAPGDTAEPSATTSLTLGEIRAVDIRSSAGGTVLLRTGQLSLGD